MELTIHVGRLICVCACQEQRENTAPTRVAEKREEILKFENNCVLFPEELLWPGDCPGMVSVSSRVGIGGGGGSEHPPGGEVCVADVLPEDDPCPEPVFTCSGFGKYRSIRTRVQSAET